MSRSHHFHMDQLGHSITVNVGPCRDGEIELLVNGKVVAYRKEHSRGMNVLCGELPGEPSHPFRVLVREPHLVPSTPRCTLELDGIEQPMPERLVI
ncbi:MULTISPECIES: hypothetical protein [Streptomyces]|uniref:Uncharacterized protein n=2 Tax=Streptomyces TaxID=1883 RepID=A0A1V0TTI3_9ACTN|nr:MULTISPECIES: hypothetical protein [Streptomyces]ARF56256.1 hypothetical protein B1H19_20575 [Streptomyces gilvosporeus]KIZ19516.1 hypothetical protein SNA_03095 [Streptomyces natalensis ATCC 27448]